MKFRQYISAACGLVWIAVGAPVLAVDVESGLGWLEARQGAEGVHRAADIATAERTNLEAWRTVGLAGRDDGFGLLRARALGDAVQLLASEALRAELRINTGVAASMLLDTLLGQQLADGGFPSHPGFESDPETTARVLAALDRAGRGGGTPAARAIGFLAASQRADGSWRSAFGDDGSVATTAVVLPTLVAYRNRFELSVPISRARALLFDARDTDGSFGSAFETALAVEALLMAGERPDALESSIDWLSARQRADGSFDGDAFTTALALRAFLRWDRPVSDPGLAGLTVRVVSADTRLPIAGATLALQGPAPGALVSNNDGVIFNTTLAAGNYMAELGFPGMRPVMFDVTLLADQLSDLGEIRLSRLTDGGNARGLIRGQVRARTDDAPIANARIDVQPDGLSATTDAAGRFQVLEVAPGPIELLVEADGFSSQSGQADLGAGEVIEFSVVLDALPPSATGARVSGSVTNGLDGTPIADATIRVVDPTGGSELSSVQSGVAGRHQQTVQFEGVVEVLAEAGGFDPVSIQTRLTDRQVFDFSPRMFPVGQTPPGANRSRISATIVSQASREPIRNALVIVNDPAGQQSVRSGNDGRVLIDDLSGPTTRLEISADAFDPARVLVSVLPVKTGELGEVALKPTTVEVFFPDLVITNTSLTSTDPDSFVLADQVTVEIANRGTSVLRQEFDVVAFLDANGDGQWQPGPEPEIGRGRVRDDLPIGSAAELAIAVEAQLAWRDAPFALVVDPDNEVPEQDETNNVGSTLLGCRATPAFIGNDSIVEAWRWSGLSSNPDINSISQTPAVGQLTADNGDGVINEFDVPDIVFVAGRRSSSAPSQTALVAISGDDGREHWARTDIRLSQFSSPALGDIDNDGIAEIIAVRNYRQELIAFEHTGDVKWRTPLDGPGIPPVLIPPPPHVYDMPIIVNLEGDNEAEVILGREVFRGLTGEQLWQGEFDGGGSAGGVPVQKTFSQAAVAADVDLDGITDIIAGRTRYDFAGNAVWHRDDIKPETFKLLDETPASHSGYVGIGNFDLDDFAEIVLTIDDEVWLLEHDGTTIWGPVMSPDFTGLGAPTILDLDADGLPEIVISSNTRLTVLETDGTVKWTAEISDPSGVTSATAFDFENDGLLELIHNDEEDFRIFDARTGALLFETRHTSPTVFEYPIVADVDGDKQAEVVLTGFDRDLQAGVTPGIRVFKARNGAWADAGSVWGSHAFHINEVNENSTLPLIETPSWLTHNTYRMQMSPLPDPLGRPDFTLGDLRLIDQGPGRNPVVQVRVGNSGPVDAHQPGRLGLFVGDPDAGGQLLNEVRLDTLRAARFQIINLGEVPAGLSGELFAVVDHPDLAEECREGNNRRSIPFAASNGRGALSLATDALSYAPNDVAVVTSTVANQGGTRADFEVRLAIIDSAGNRVTELQPRAVAGLLAGQQAAIDQSWRAVGVLGGTFTVEGELLNAAGRVVDTASAGFVIEGAQSGLAGIVDVQLDQAEYLPRQPVEVALRVTNVSDNTPIESPQVVLIVDGPAGEVMREDLLLDRLMPAAFADLRVQVSGADQAAGYNVRAVLRSALTGAELDTDNNVFTRLDDAARILQATAEAASASLVAGQTQTCLYTLRNAGSVDLSNLVVRKSVMHGDSGDRIASMTETLALAAGVDQLSFEDTATVGLAPGDYLCALELGPAPDWRPLDADGFELLGLPPAGIERQPSGALTTDEGGAQASFTLVLTRAPSADVVIDLDVADPSEWSLSVDELVFTPATWNLPRTVTITGMDDGEVDGDQNGRIAILPAVSSDPAYAGLDAADVEVINLDDDPPAITVTPTSVTTSEEGQNASFEVGINAQPSANVSIELLNPDAGEWAVTASSLVFTPQDWAAPRVVTVEGLDDDQLDGDIEAVLQVLPATSADVRFDGLNPDDVTLINLDNDAAVVRVTPPSVTTREGGAPGQFTVSLSAAPTALVRVPIGPVDPGEWQVPALEVVLDAGNWQSGEIVIVQPVDDDGVDGTQTATLALGPSESADPRFHLLDPPDVALTNHDNDGAQILVEPAGGLILEERGTTAEFTVRLSQVPNAPVRVPVVSGDETEFAVDRTLLEFTPANALTPQIVTVTGLDDDEVDGNIAGRIELGASASDDAVFAGIDSLDVSVTNIDDEQVAIIVSPDEPVRTDENGASVTLSVALNHAPTAPVRVDLDRSPEDEWSLSTTAIEFLPADWQTPRQFVVSGLDDDEVDGPVIGVIRLAAAASDDARYNGIDPPDLPAVNADNDIAGNPNPPPDFPPIPVPMFNRLTLLLLALMVLMSTALFVARGSNMRRTKQ